MRDDAEGYGHQERAASLKDGRKTHLLLNKVFNHELRFTILPEMFKNHFDYFDFFFLWLML